MNRLRHFIFLPLAVTFGLVNWFFINYEIFPQSRTSLSFGFGMFLVLILFLGLISTLSIPLIYLFGKKPHSVIWQTSLLTMTIVSFWLTLAGYLPRNLPTESDLLKFDSDAWKKDESMPLPKDLVTARQKMLEDLVENVLPDKTKEEIINILGPQTETSNFKGGYDLIYVLGPQRDSVMGLDYEWLLMHFKNGRFRKYSIEVD